ncbi:hypothetical protein NPIL_508561 [Nephila pilipes]|uniref:Uncharacterized protein n=1 Tax=Nephila pilipes TaxID=299642 RepID=A0A8X6JSX9_NEPPI|nr:hypothetical protein NPIL_508561 [Nephila pilipes]
MAPTTSTLYTVSLMPDPRCTWPFKQFTHPVPLEAPHPRDAQPWERSRPVRTAIATNTGDTRHEHSCTFLHPSHLSHVRTLDASPPHPVWDSIKARVVWAFHQVTFLLSDTMMPPQLLCRFVRVCAWTRLTVHWTMWSGKWL